MPASIQMLGVAITILTDRTQSSGEWARDADADGICEIHTNTIEGIWTTLQNFLRPFRGVHKNTSLATLLSVSLLLI